MVVITHVIVWSRRFPCVSVLAIVPHSFARRRKVVAMSDEQTPQPQWHLVPEHMATPARVPQPQPVATPRDPQAPEDLASQLVQVDPLLNRPRRSSMVLCIVFGVLFLALGGLAYWLGVHTVLGQSYEDQVITSYASRMPAFLSSTAFPFSNSLVVIITSLVMGALALVVALVRKRWWLAVQLAGFIVVAFIASRVLKPVLPRPFLIHVESSTTNSAPSGHVMMAAIASVALLCAVPRVWRAACALIGVLFTLSVGFSVVTMQWHRPIDVVMAMFITGGLVLLMLACTARSGMDRPGKRVPSASVQIVASALIALGVCAYAYATYVIWEISLGLSAVAAWTARGADDSATALIVGTVCVVFGLVLSLRQLTASPLSKMGLIGTPPTPPKRRS